MNQKLRAIENPQHIDWEIKRLDEDLDEKKLTRDLKNDLEETVRAYIEEVLRQSTGESTDIEGAGDFLPAEMEDGDAIGGSNGNEEEAVTATQPKRVAPINPKTQKANDKGQSYEFGDGGVGEEEYTKDPNPNQDQPNPNPDPVHEPKEDDQNGENGDKKVLKLVPLGGMKYKNIVVDKKAGKYDIIFDSLYDEDNCELIVRQYGEGTDKYPINITSATVNGANCIVDNGKIIGLSIKKGQKYKVSYQISLKELFSSEVIVNAYRK